MNALELKRLSVQYGGLQAVDAVDIELAPGTIFGLIGPNGAGKTTLIDAATGFTSFSGQVLLSGHDVSDLPAHQRARMGMSRTWQGIELFSELSVRDNVRVATERPSIRCLLADSLRPRREHAKKSVEAALELVGIRHLGDAMPSELSTGHQKLVGIARALAGDARVVFLDEPAAGLGRTESNVLSSHLRHLIDSGISVLLVEHDMHLVFAVCDRLAVLEQGRIIAVGAPDEVRKSPAVVAAYLGSPATASAEGELDL